MSYTGEKKKSKGVWVEFQKRLDADMNEPLLILYAVQNRDGKFFRAKGYGGSGETWVDELKGARIYSRPGPARSQVTFFSSSYPSFGVPKLVELHVTAVVEKDETKRVQKSQDRKAIKEEERRVRHAQWEKEQAQRKLNEAQETLNRIRAAEAGRKSS